ncbi:response regulator [Larkinella sp. VNQ87]|uniref:response regulator n=1 Tax=Larkinella sp. VNQ87 TaxID=3400921 RepID=UPI003C0ECC98
MNPTIYIIEDNDDNLFLYEWIFVRHLPDYSFHLFSDGLSVQHHVGRATQKPDLILLDLKMPNVSGFELLTHFKTDPSWKHIPVVIFSHSTSPREIEACYQAGASGFVHKEISVHGIKSQLQSICHQWLQQGRLSV